MKKARITMISLAAIAACACVSMGAKAIDVNAATTPTYATFKMQEGASVRVGNVKDENDVVIDSGLRFCAEISADEYNALIGVGAKFGMIIAASDQLGDVELNEKNVFEDPLVYYDGQENADTSKIMVTNVRAEYADVDNDGAKEICGALTNIKESNLTRPFVGRAYVAIPSKTETVETEDGTTEYEYHFAPYYANDGYTADDVQNNTRSVYYVAQKAVEAGDSSSDELKDALKEDYINKLSNKNYKYIINYHYKDADTTETHLQTAKFARLNSTVTMDKETEYPDEITRTLADGTKKTYELAPVTNAGLARSGLVYATLLQEFHVYYIEKTASEEQNAQATLENMISDTTKAELYFEGKLAYNAETGELEATTESGWAGLISPGQKSVIFTPAFIYELQQAGAKYLRVKTIYATPTELFGLISITETTCVKVEGYYTSSQHFSNRDSSIETEGTIGGLTTVDEKTYLTAGSDGYIYFDISKAIKLDGSNYTYNDGSAAEGITFKACNAYNGDNHASEMGREWIIKELAALTAEQVPTGEGLIIVQ